MIEWDVVREGWEVHLLRAINGGGSGHGPEGKLRSLEKTERALGMWREQEGLICEVKKVAVPC